jgi:hypothetical protein
VKLSYLEKKMFSKTASPTVHAEERNEGERCEKLFFQLYLESIKKELHPISCFEKGCLQKKNKAHNSS